MTRTNNDKWQSYEQALLCAMGFDPVSQSPNVTTATYQFLIIPTFHPPCCLKLLLIEQEGELHVSLLRHHAADLFQAIWQENTQAERDTIAAARYACIEDITALHAAQVAIVRQTLTHLEPLLLSDINLAARDGVSIRCECFAQNRVHTFAMRSPTMQEAPRHTALIRFVVDLAQAQFPHPQLQAYFIHMQRYLH